jgi:hypothetical protein
MDAHLANWIAGSIAIITTVLVQFGAQSLLVRLARVRRARMPHLELRDPLLVLPILVVIFVLLFGHVLQMAIWAAAYMALGELSDLSDAIYFSMASYTTIGASHLDLSTAHRILGALEAGVGVLMFGWSTAVLVSLLSQADPMA